VAHLDSSGQSSPSPGPSGVQEPSAGELAPTPIRILLAMAAELDRMAWSIVINNQPDMDLVAATSSSRQLVRLFKLHTPDVVLLDEALLDLDSPGALLACARKTSCRFVLIAMHQPDYSLEPSRLPPIHARLLKGVTAPELLRTVRAVALQGSAAPAPPAVAQSAVR
jgi:DNA-binding NarL/FixJ family response regulator